MLDLNPTAVRKFWQDYEDKNIFRIITFMESVEDWTLDGNAQFEEKIKILATKINNYKASSLASMQAKDDLITLLAFLKTGRALRLLHKFDTIQPGIVSDLLIYAEENTQINKQIVMLFLRRNTIFEKLRLINRIFSNNRLNFILQSLEVEGAT